MSNGDNTTRLVDYYRGSGGLSLLALPESEAKRRAWILRNMIETKFNSEDLKFIIESVGLIPHASHSMMTKQLLIHLFGGTTPHHSVLEG